VCPIKHEAPVSPAPAKCPVHDAPAQLSNCPINHESVDPRNQMPSKISQAPSPHQNIILPTEREESSIPRDTSAKWDYPSPQQFYNALVRKGWETPEEHVETMVQIHNFLNEQAWSEVLKWEKRQYKCVIPSAFRTIRQLDARYDDVQLARLQGRPGELSPKARFWLFAVWLFPSRFKSVHGYQ
jgi:hypothetical protein